MQYRVSFDPSHGPKARFDGDADIECSQGAFTPSCSVNHLPGYIKNLSAIKSKGVDIVAVIAYNDPFVMSAWGKANHIKGDDIVSTI